MAMIIVILLTLSTAYSANESLYESHSVPINITRNRTLDDFSYRNASDDDVFEEDEDSLLNLDPGRAAESFWDAFESENRSYLESYTILPPLSPRQMAVTEATTVETESIGNDVPKMTSPTTVASEVTTYSQEDQVTKPLGDVWPVKLAAEVPGDLIIGGLMMVHEREDTITCGPIMPQGGIQAVETMLYTLDTVNKGLKHFSIGVHILDDCDKDTYGLEMAVDFIKEVIDALNPNPRSNPPPLAGWIQFFTFLWSIFC